MQNSRVMPNHVDNDPGCVKTRLTGRLAPDHKTIADFHKDSQDPERILEVRKTSHLREKFGESRPLVTPHRPRALVAIPRSRGYHAKLQY
jgi:hypothetical protein